MPRPPAKPGNVTPITTRQGVIQSTGEVVDVEFPATRGRRRVSRRKSYAMVDLDALDQLELTGMEWRVLHRMMRAINQETNEVRIRGSELARDTGMDPASISHILSGFRDRRIIKTLRLGQHRINPHLVYRGSNQDWDTATEFHPEPLWRRP